MATPLSEIKLTDIDFDVVKKCNDKKVLKRYLKLLEDDGNYFTDLLKACKNKLLEVAPKDYYLLFPRVASVEEVDEAIRDVLEWEAAVKETDAALQKSRKDQIWDGGPKIRAPVRGQEPIVARANINNSKEREREAPKQKETYARDNMKMKDYYGAWDSVDVDALEADMDREAKEEEERRQKHFEELREQQEEAHATTPIQVGNFPEGVPEVHRKYLADSEKEKGNEAFYSKDFEEAEAYYSRSLNFCGDDPSTWANRALVRLKLNKFDGALQDCDSSLALNPRYMKALHRKGKALHELRRYAEAVKFFQLALAESPENSQINGDLMVSRRHLRQEEKAPEGPPQSFQPPPRVNAPSRTIVEELPDDEAPAPSQGPSAPLPGYTRVLIEEDSDSESDGGEASPHDLAAAAPGGAIASGAPPPAEKPRVYHKIAIVEESDSEGEEPPAPACAPAASSASRPAASSSGPKPTPAEPTPGQSRRPEPTPEPAPAPTPAVAHAAPPAATAAAVAAAVVAAGSGGEFVLNDLD